MKVRFSHLLALSAVAAAAHAACGSDDAARPDVDGGAVADASTPDRVAENPDAETPDACAPREGEGKACNDTPDCTCGTLCVLKTCVRRSACDEALLQWDGHAIRADGTCVLDLAGFNVRFGREAGVYTEVVDAGMPCLRGPMVGCGDAGHSVPSSLKCAYRLEHLEAGTWYFVTTAYSDAGLESPASNEASKTVACP